MSKPKRHHTLPEMYLRRFAVEDRVWVADLGQDEVRSQSVGDTTVVKHYYSRILGDGEKDTAIEESLAQIESEVAASIGRLISGEDITQAQRSTIALFLALLRVRVPDWEKEAVELDAHFAGKDPSAAPLMKANERLNRMVYTAEDLAPRLNQYEWAVAHYSGPATGFATCDAPFIVVPWHDKPVLPGTVVKMFEPGVEMYLPLSPSACLRIASGSGRLLHGDVHRSAITQVNRQIACNAERFLIARDHAQAQRLARLARCARQKGEEASERAS